MCGMVFAACMGLLAAFHIDAAAGDGGSGVARDFVPAAMESLARYEYDNHGRTARVTDPEGGVVEYGRDDRGNCIVKRQKIAEGVWAEYRREFDQWNRLVRESGPMGEESRYIRNQRGLTRCILTRVDDNRWSGEYYEYDRRGKMIFKSIPVWVTDPERYEAFLSHKGRRFGYDDEGRIVYSVGPDDRSAAYHYETGKRTVDVGGRLTVYEYDEAGQLVRETDAAGGVTEWSYDGAGHVSEIRRLDGTGPEPKPSPGIPNISGKYVWKDGLLLTYTDPTDRTSRFEYDAEKRLRKAVDPAGAEAEYVYNDQGLLMAVFDAAGSKTAFRYDRAGRLVKIIDVMEAARTIAYDLAGNVISDVRFDGKELVLKRDLSGRIIERGEKNDGDAWRTTRYSYDYRGNLVGTILPDGVEIRMEYDAAGNLLLHATGAQPPQRFEYDDAGRLIASVNPLGAVRKFKHDANGNVRYNVSPEGRVVEYQYDALDRVVAVTEDPDGAGIVTRISYDAAGNVTAYERDGRVWTYSYDPASRLVEARTPGKAPVLVAYDRAGRPESIEMFDAASGERIAAGLKYDRVGNIIERIGHDGRSSFYQYDRLGRMTKMRNPQGEATTVEYGFGNLPTRIVLPEGEAAEFVYGVGGDLLKTIGGPDGGWEFRHDAMGRVVEAVDANSNAIRYVYDGLGMRRAVTDSLGNDVRYEYDDAGRRIAITDGNGNTTNYAYDRDGLLVSVAYPPVPGEPDNVERYSYNSAGQLVCRVTSGGRTIRYAYDGGGRLAAMYSGEAVPDTADILPERLLVRYQRDESGLPVREEDPRAVIERAYDVFGRLKEIRDVGLNKRLVYGYGRNGLRDSLKIFDDNIAASAAVPKNIAYGWDAAGRLNRVQVEDEHPVRILYDRNGRRSHLELPNGISASYAYDGAGRISQLTASGLSGVLLDMTYGYDGVGNCIGIDYGDGGRSAFSYDAANRLVSERRLDAEGSEMWREDFRYDAVGNRLSRMSTASGRTEYSYNERNQMLLREDSDGIRRNRFDGDGNLAASAWEGGEERFEYDVLNRLVRYDGPGGSERTEYFGAGWQRRRTDVATGDSDSGGSSPVWYLYDVDDVVGDYIGSSEATSRLSRLNVTSILDDHLAYAEYGPDGGVGYYVADALGSVRAILDGQGAVSASFDYLSFGTEFVRDGNGNGVARFGFTGREPETASRLIYYRRRHYDPENGRFIQRDPAGYVGGLNMYAYVSNNPLGATDPFGLYDKLVHTWIHINAIREVLNLDCYPCFQAFLDGHINIDGNISFILDTRQHGLSWGKGGLLRAAVTTYSWKADALGDVYDWLVGPEARVNWVKKGWQESLDKHNNAIVDLVGRVGGDAGVMSELLKNLSFSQHVSTDPSFHKWKKFIGQHITVWDLMDSDTPFDPFGNAAKWNPMSNAERRADESAGDNMKKTIDGINGVKPKYVQGLPLPELYGPEWEWVPIAKVPKDQAFKEHVNAHHGGWDKVNEEFSPEQLQKDIRTGLEEAKQNIRDLKKRTGEKLREALLKAGCVPME